MREAIKFLNHIFSQQCEPGDYIILAAKKGNFWKDIPIRFGKGFIAKLGEFFKNYPPAEFDLYWSPMPFNYPRRQNKYSIDTKFMVQDIDECTNPSKLNPKPSYIWESSPNKYQGLWELDRYIEESEYTPLNKALATHIGCDDCFDFAHVYRIPGTINHKYKNLPPVGLPKATKAVYKPKNLRKAVGGDNYPSAHKNGHNTPSAPLQSDSLIERKIYAKYSIPKKVRDLLALESLNGVDRSGTIWYVENSLHELGMSPQEIIYLIKNSIFNKYKGRRDENSRLQKELEKIISGEIETRDEQTHLMKATEYGEVMGNCSTFEGWLVKGFWGRRSHGIVAGMPKCFKSTLVHDLIISVASGRPFLGKFPVLEPGPVLVIQNENADYIMKDRTEKIILDRGLVGNTQTLTSKKLHVEFPPDLPITFLNQQGFTLSNQNHREQIESIIKRIKPVLVVFDPLYLMFDGDLNSSKELNPTLNWLLNLKTEYRTSVMVIHHYNKGSNQQTLRGGARMAGSVMLYGWVESAWYLTRNDEDEESDNHNTIMDPSEGSGSSTVTLSREFRMAGGYPDIDIHFEMGEIGNPSYRVTVGASGEPHVTIKTLEDEILGLLRTSNAPVTKRALLENLGVSGDALRRALESLLKSKKVIPLNKGYSISKS